jgi:hypothetical protein
MLSASSSFATERSASCGRSDAQRSGSSLSERSAASLTERSGSSLTDRSSYGGLFGGPGGSSGAPVPPSAESSSPSLGAATSPSKAGLGGLFEQGPKLGGLFDQAPALHEQQGGGLFGSGGLGAGAAPFQDGRPGALGPSGPGLLKLSGGLDTVSGLAPRLPARAACRGPEPCAVPLPLLTGPSLPPLRAPLPRQAARLSPELLAAHLHPQLGQLLPGGAAGFSLPGAPNGQHLARPPAAPPGAWPGPLDAGPAPPPGFLAAPAAQLQSRPALLLGPALPGQAGAGVGIW